MRQSRCGVVVFEGPDGSGKTVAASGQAFLGEFCHKQGPYEKDPFWSSIDIMEAQFKCRRYMTFDRFFHGERIYGPALRGEDKLGRIKERILERRMLAERCHLVVCMPPLGEVLENWARTKDSQLPQTQSQMEEIYAGYIQLVERTHMPVTIYDYTKGDYYRVMGDVMRRAYERINPAHGIGQWKTGNIAVVSHFDPTCDLISNLDMTSVLEESGLREDQSYWFSSKKLDIHESLRWIEIMQPSAVIFTDDTGDDAFNWRAAAGRMVPTVNAVKMLRKDLVPALSALKGGLF